MNYAAVAGFFDDLKRDSDAILERAVRLRRGVEDDPCVADHAQGTVDCLVRAQTALSRAMRLCANAETKGQTK